MSQINISSLLSGSTGALDGAQPRSATGNGQSQGQGSAVGDFANLIAGRLAQQSTGQSGRSSAPASSSQGGSLKAQPIDMAGIQLRQAVAAMQGQSSQAAGSATSGGSGGETLADLVSQIRQQLAQYLKQAGSATSAGSAATGQQFTQLAQSLNKLLAQLGLSTQSGQGQSTAAGLGSTTPEGKASVEGGLKQFMQMIKSLQNALERLRQRVEQSGGDMASASALLQQVQAHLQQLSAEAAKLQQQSASLTQNSLNTLLKRLDGALAQLQGASSGAGQVAGAGSQQASGVQQMLAGLSSGSSSSTDGGAGSGTHPGTARLDAKDALSASVGQADTKAGASGNQPAWLTSLLKQHVAAGKAAHAAANTVGHGGTGQATGSTAGLVGAQPAATGQALASSQLSSAAQWLLTQSKDGRQLSADSGSSTTAGRDMAGVGATYSAAGLVPNTQLSGVLGGSGGTPQVNPQLAANVGQQISWMVSKNLSSASINVSPAELGPLKIHVQMQQDGGLQVQLLAHQHVTRDALEQSLPRLREWLQEAGLGNAQVSVGADASGGGFAQFANGSANQGGAGNGGSSASTHGAEAISSASANDSQLGSAVSAVQGPLSILDIFA